MLVTGEQVSAGKPAPEPYLAGIDRAFASFDAGRSLADSFAPGLRERQADLTPLDVLVVEDALAGFESAYAAGARLLAVCTGPVAAKEVDEAAGKISGALVVKDLTA